MSSGHVWEQKRKCTAQSPLITCRADKEEPEDDRALHRIPFSPVHSEVYLAIGVGSWHLHVVIEFERYLGTHDGALQEKQQHHDLALHAIDMCGRMGLKRDLRNDLIRQEPCVIAPTTPGGPNRVHGWAKNKLEQA